VASKGTSIREFAARYAVALYELASERNAVDQVLTDVRTVAQALRESPELDRLVRSAAIPNADRERGMLAVAKALGLSELCRQFIGVVAHNGRLFVLPQLIEGFEEAVAEQRGVIRAEVTVARPMTEAQGEAVAAALKAAVGAAVAIEVAVDPALLGGMIVKVGSKMVDNSLRSKIDRLQLIMKAPGGTF